MTFHATEFVPFLLLHFILFESCSYSSKRERSVSENFRNFSLLFMRFWNKQRCMGLSCPSVHSSVRVFVLFLPSSRVWRWFIVPDDSAVVVLSQNIPPLWLRLYYFSLHMYGLCSLRCFHFLVYQFRIDKCVFAVKTGGNFCMRCSVFRMYSAAKTYDAHQSPWCVFCFSRIFFFKLTADEMSTKVYGCQKWNRLISASKFIPLRVRN